MPAEALILRPATGDDVGPILDIYSYYVKNTVITFEEEPPSLEDFARRIETISATYPYLVCETGGKLCGWAYASRFRERIAYRFDAETSIYVAPGAHSCGIGTALYSALLKLLRELGYVNAYAGIALPNEKSVRLHEKLGFQKTGTWKKTGYKQGRWIDVLWMCAALAAHNVPPAEPRAVAVLNKAFWDGVLHRHL